MWEADESPPAINDSRLTIETQTVVSAGGSKPPWTRWLSSCKWYLLASFIVVGLGLGVIAMQSRPNDHEHLILFGSSSSDANTSHPSLGLVVCTLVKNENQYLPEWIEFHALQGVDKFVIYDYHSITYPYEQLFPYLMSGLVELVRWPPANLTDYFLQTGLDKEPEDMSPTILKNCSSWSCQKSALTDCVGRYSPKAKWLGIWDVDEFIFADLSKSTCGSKAIGGTVGCYEKIMSQHNLKTIMDSAFDEYGTTSFTFEGLAFGTNGYAELGLPICPLTVPLVTERFLFRTVYNKLEGWIWDQYRRATFYNEPGTYRYAQKQILHASVIPKDFFIRRCYWLHTCYDCCKGRQEYKWEKIKARVLKMNHYQCRSERYIQSKYLANTGQNFSLEEIQQNQEWINKEFDPSAALFSAEITRRLMLRKGLQKHPLFLNSSCFHAGHLPLSSV